MKTNIKYIIILFACFSIMQVIICGCKKQDDFLNVKAGKTDVTPNSLKDVQALLDNDLVLNNKYLQMGLVGADNLYITDENQGQLEQYERNAYIWAKDIYQAGNDLGWTYCYKAVGYANIALETLNKIKPAISEQDQYNNLKGLALFFRSMAFYNVADLYCLPYNKGTAKTDVGIPIRIISDVNEPSSRNTVEQTYSQMIGDLKQAITLLPDKQLYTTRPSNVCALALLSKIYLEMEDYPNALTYSDMALKKNSILLDFNSSLVSPTSAYRFPDFYTGNPEILLFATGQSISSVWSYPSAPGWTPPELYNLYEDNDLRKSLFYNKISDNKIKFQGNYTGTLNNFCGLAINELYLIRSECNARINNVPAAMQDLNALLVKRYVTGTFKELKAASADDALRIILQERRKELPYTGQLRWEDLRRLNKDPRFAKTLTRIVNGKTYTLPPNDKRYVFPIPTIEIQMYGMPQNER